MGLFLPSGTAGRWIHRVSDNMEALVTATTPTRSGWLEKQNYVKRVAATSSFFGNQYVASYEVGNNARYADYVHSGTRPHGGGWMRLPAGGPGVNTVSRYRGQRFSKKVLRFVDGQTPNPWLNDACARVAMSYGAIPYSI